MHYQHQQVSHFNLFDTENNQEKVYHGVCQKNDLVNSASIHKN